jgi:hypothetical protein
MLSSVLAERSTDLVQDESGSCISILVLIIPHSAIRSADLRRLPQSLTIAEFGEKACRFKQISASAAVYALNENGLKSVSRS